MNRLTGTVGMSAPGGEGAYAGVCGGRRRTRPASAHPGKAYVTCSRWRRHEHRLADRFLTNVR